MKLLPIAAAVALCSIPGHELSAQVILNEVNFTKNAQWIELFNKGTTTTNLGTWSIYQATKTTNRFGDYWWGFPTTTEIKAGAYLRINWGAAIQTNPPPGVINTGDSNWNFLFGHGYEALDPDQGVIAICTTQNNKLVNSVNIFNDWWQWGATGFKRESVATGNKPTSLWPVNTAYPKVPAGASMMVLDFLHGFPHQLSSFRNDFSPTPLAHNSEGMSVTTESKTCSWNMKDVSFSSRGYPFHGNKDFQLVTGNTRGPAFFESMFLIVRFTNTTQSYSFCDQLLSLTGIFWTTPFVPTNNIESVLTVPLTPANAAGVTVYIQSIVFAPTSLSISNHLKLTVSK